MSEFIAFDSHKVYTLAEREDRESGRCRQTRINHERGAIRSFLSECEPGTSVAVEATGNWYWIVDEIEAASLVPKLVHPRKAKLMMGSINKTDKLDVHGLNRLQRTGTLPTVWIPPGELRDLRELTRTRMVFVSHRTRLKNRIQATLSRYGLRVKEWTDSFGVNGRKELEGLVSELPEHTHHVTRQLLDQLDFLQGQIVEEEKRLNSLVKTTPEMELLMSLPGVGLILTAVMVLEIGEVERFPTAEHLASYSGTVPRVHASGGKVRYGRLRPDVNRYLKWAFTEAASSVSRQAARYPDRHGSRLYIRIKKRKGHAKAIGAVARHLAEATWHVLTKMETYREPTTKRTTPREPKRDTGMSP